MRNLSATKRKSTGRKMQSREWKALAPEVRAKLEELQQSLPISLAAIARALGVRVKAATLPPGIAGEIRPDGAAPGEFVVRVNRHDIPERQRFTVAHELGHFLLHRDQIGTGIKDDVLFRSRLSDWREAEANRIAADILMPEELVKQALQQAKSIGIEDVAPYLAKQFGVSEAAMKIRLGIN